MRVLALDTALGACAAAVLDIEQEKILASETLVMTRGHAEALVPLIARVMGKADIAFWQLDRIAATTGPGSFTGLRVGISAARGISLAAGKPAVGVSTLAAYAAPYIATNDADPVLAVIDARHGHVYLQVFGAGGRTLVGPQIISLREVARVVGKRPRVVGSAADLVATAWPRGENPPSVIDTSPAPAIAWVARLGAGAEVDTPPKPLYLRAPDAQPQDAARLPRR